VKELKDLHNLTWAGKAKEVESGEGIERHTQLHEEIACGASGIR